MAELNLDIISLNTAGLGDFTKRRKIFNYLKKHVSRKGAVFLQETQCKKGQKFVDKPVWLWRQINDILTWEIGYQKSAN